VAMEDPTFPNVHSIFKSCLAKLKPLPLDDEGIDISKLKQTDKPKIIHTTPSNHYPLGVKMSKKRRLELLQWASQNKAYIVENDYEHEVANALHTEPSIFSLDQEQRTLYLGTFNRLLFPSIRLGFMVVPMQLVSVLQALQEHSHRFVSPLTQLAMGQFIERNLLYLHFKKLNEVAQKREKSFTQFFKENIAKLELQDRGYDSLHKVALFKKEVSIEKELALENELVLNDISVFPLSKCYINAKPLTGLIMGFSTVRTSLMKNKLLKMEQIIKQFKLG
jgi:GntR family transcriptional regulator/MocR family aminotransferase